MSDDGTRQQPMPVRWFACGYRDGYTGVERGDPYFFGMTEPDLVAYAKGVVAGRLQARREERHKQFLARAEEIAGC